MHNRMYNLEKTNQNPYTPEFPGNPRNQKCNMQQPVFPLKSQPTIEAKNAG